MGCWWDFLGWVRWHRPSPACSDSNCPASMAERESRARSELLVTEVLGIERCGLTTTHLDSFAPSIEDPSKNPAAFSCLDLIYDDFT